MTRFTALGACYHGDTPAALEAALSSVYANSLSPSEVIVVVDGPIPELLEEVLHQFVEKFSLRVIRNASNLGLAAALNSGLSEASNDHVARFDADDCNKVNRFEILMAKLSEGYDLVGSYIEEVDQAGKVVALRDVPISEVDIKKKAAFRNPFNHMSVAFSKAAVMKVGGYPSFHLREDYALWAKMIANEARVCNLSEVLVRASAGAGMYERRGGFKYALAEFRLQKHLVRLGLQSSVNGVVIGSLRAAVFLLPSAVRGWIYIHLLRKNSTVAFND